MRITSQQLLERGDAAARAGDGVRLSRIATALADRVGDPFAAYLGAFAQACRAGTVRSLRSWPRLRAAIADRIATAGS